MNSFTPIEIAGMTGIWAWIIIAVLSVVRNFLHPLFIFICLWGAIILFSITAGSGYYFSVHAIMFITGIVACFATGWLASGNSTSATKSCEAGNYSLKIDRVIIAAGFFGGAYAVYTLLLPAFTQSGSYGIIENIKRLSATLSRARYEGDRLDPTIMLGITFNYLACFVGGADFSKERHWLKKSACLMPLMTLLAFTIISTSRAVLLFGILIFISVHLLTISGNYNSRKFPVRWIITGFGIVLGGLLLFIISQGLRMGISLNDGSRLAFIFNYLKVWFAGNISSFCIWYDQNDLALSAGLGRHTFAGIAEWLGLGQRELGIYNIAFDISGRMEFSNIYSLFRFIADDFGYTGSFVFVFLAGLAGGFLYRKHLAGGLVASAVLSGIMIEMNFSFITSVLAYNSVLVALMIYIIKSIAFVPLKSQCREI